MAGLSTPGVDELTESGVTPPLSWQTVVWDDPVNMMQYVVHVFRTYFGYDADTAYSLMLQVHNGGHAVVARGPRELMELHVQAMHDYGLWATVRKDT